MVPVHLLNELFDIDCLAFPLIERADASIDVGPQLAQLLDMRKELAADFFLVGVRKTGHLGDGSLQRFDHT